MTHVRAAGRLPWLSDPERTELPAEVWPPSLEEHAELLSAAAAWASALGWAMEWLTHDGTLAWLRRIEQRRADLEALP